MAAWPFTHKPSVSPGEMVRLTIAAGMGRFLRAGALLLGFLAWAGETWVVVINEFGQGVAGNGEWVELLVVGTGPCSTVDLRGYRLLDREGYLDGSSPTRVVFRSVPAWAAVPAGTIIVIYNGAPAEAGNFPPNFPFNDLDFSDFRVSIPHTNTDFFENVAWGGFGNAGDYVVLVDSLGNLVDGLSYGNRTGEATSPEVKLSTVGANTAAWFTGGSTAFINDPAYWATGSESAGASTPGAPNGGANTTWRNSLLPRPTIEVTPASHDFGALLLGQESLPLTVTVANTGCADLLAGTVSLTGPNADEFEVRDDEVSGAAIPSGGSRELRVVFKPVSAGTKAASLRIPSNDPANPEISVALGGTGVSPLAVSVGGPQSGVVGLPVTLQASVSGGFPPYSVAWDLDGDGEYDDAFGTEVLWTWTLPGTYVVAVQATDSTGAQATAQAEIRIFPPKGDVNGDGRIDLVDLRLAFQAALGIIVLSSEEQYRADLNDDGIVDMEDVTLLCGMILGGCG